MGLLKSPGHSIRLCLAHSSSGETYEIRLQELLAQSMVWKRHKIPLSLFPHVLAFVHLLIDDVVSAF